MRMRHPFVRGKRVNGPLNRVFKETQQDELAEVIRRLEALEHRPPAA